MDIDFDLLADCDGRHPIHHIYYHPYGIKKRRPEISDTIPGILQPSIHGDLRQVPLVSLATSRAFGIMLSQDHRRIRDRPVGNPAGSQFWHISMAGWWFGCHFLCSHILGIIIPIDFHIFQRGGPTTNLMEMWLLAIEKTWLESPCKSKIDLQGLVNREFSV